MARKRWMTSILKAASGTKLTLPWERAQRTRLVARRKLQTAKAKFAGA
jgi:hypothetical protein